MDMGKHLFRGATAIPLIFEKLGEGQAESDDHTHFK